MYAKFFAIAALVSAVVALPQNNISQCNVGTVQCCNSVQNVDHHSVRTAVTKAHGQGLLGDLTVDDFLNELDVPVGLTCDPISVIGAGSNSCSAQPTCCTGNSFNGLVVVGCSPINASL